MKTLAKSSRLDHVCYDIRGPVLDEAKRLEEEGVRILKLNIGNPAPFGFHAPDDIVRDMMENLREADGYSDSRGIHSARRAVVEYYQERGVKDIGVDSVYLGNGVSEFISIVMHALLEPGDEVLIPAPDYPLWTACAALAGGNPVHYPCDEAAQWNPDVASLEKKIGPRTKAIVIINPNNPTGALYDTEVLLRIAELARRHGLLVFADEIYDRVLYDGNVHAPFAALAPDIPVITLNGISKASFGAGYRAAWMLVSGDRAPIKSYIEGIEMLCNMRLCANVPSQFAIQASLGSQECIREATGPGGRLSRQRDACVDMLNSIPGVSCVKPKGALYCFPRFDIERFGIKDDKEFIRDFLREKKVLLVQGTGFNWPRGDHARIVFLPDEATLKDAVGRLGAFLAERDRGGSRAKA
jgi:alanine-synthesizing transaminase